MMNAIVNRNAILLLLTCLIPATAAAQGPRINLDSLKHLADKAAEVVAVDVDAAMLKQTVGFLAGKGRDDNKLRGLVEDIDGIYVKSFEFKTVNAYSLDDIETIRKQVASSGWSRVVSVREKNELSEIYFWKDRDEAGGLVVIAAEPRELTVVNIVGRVDLNALSVLGKIVPKLLGVTILKN